MARKISEDCLYCLKKWEGLRLQAYQDVSGVWTIDYGHTGKAGKPTVIESMMITEKKLKPCL
ncbi:phage related lysozyme [Bartonella henselae]|uniref:Lysozyme n=1 Tax=Bartonella henselae TaxID=38323 RepID=X5MEK6_BARHN|nr:phage related lysozyme [Bartonella henselae]